LRIAISAWESALKNIPDNGLLRAYEHAADNWDWVNGKAFSADAVLQSYTILIIEDRQRLEAERRNAAKQNPDTYRCFHCLDVGYQPVYSYRLQGWYSALRPCSCEAAPASQRQEFPLSMEFVRSKYGEYARLTDIEQYGVPTDAFKDCINSK